MANVVLNGAEYGTDDSAANNLAGGGYRTLLIQMFIDAMVEINIAKAAQTYAADALAYRNSAQSAAAGYSATSTDSMSVSVASKSFTATATRQFQAGAFVEIFRTSDTSKWMWGQVTSYNSTTGAMVVDVSVINGTGTFTDWTIIISGVRGASGVPAGMARRAITGADTVLSTDSGKFLDLSGTAYTLAFQACATLGADTWFPIKNGASGIITLDPNSAEQINGASTYSIAPGHSVMVQCDGSALRIVYDIGPKQTRYPLFSASTVSKTAVTVLETMEDSLVSSGLSIAATRIAFGSGLFIVHGTASTANVASTPDGITYTLRAMPSTAAWVIDSDGSGFVGIVPNATTTAKSAFGTTWAAATALPGAARATFANPVFVGSLCMVIGNAATTAYTSNDYGATAWTTVTLPTTPGNMNCFSVGGNFWYWSSGTTAYTSTTAATGTWTSRTMPFTPNSVWQDFDGALIGIAGAGGNYYRTTDGITWTDLGFGAANANVTPLRTINGVYANFNTTFGQAATRQSTSWIVRKTLLNDVSANAKGVKDVSGTIFLIPHNAGTTGQVGRVAPTEAATSTAIFEG